MTDDYWGYPVYENTGDTADPSIDDVVALTLERARSPREGHSDTHLDTYVHDAVEEFGAEKVEECVRVHIHEGLPQRSTGATVFGEDNYIWGINVGVAASAYLRELRADNNEDAGESGVTTIQASAETDTAPIEEFDTSEIGRELPDDHHDITVPMNPVEGWRLSEKTMDAIRWRTDEGYEIAVIPDTQLDAGETTIRVEGFLPPTDETDAIPAGEDVVLAEGLDSIDAALETALDELEKRALQFTVELREREDIDAQTAECLQLQYDISDKGDIENF